MGTDESLGRSAARAHLSQLIDMVTRSTHSAIVGACWVRRKRSVVDSHTVL